MSLQNQSYFFPFHFFIHIYFPKFNLINQFYGLYPDIYFMIHIILLNYLYSIYYTKLDLRISGCISIQYVLCSLIKVCETF